MESVDIKSEAESDTEDDISNGLDADTPLTNGNTNHGHESAMEPDKDCRLSKQHAPQQDRINHVSAFHEDSEFPLLLNRSKTTTYSRKRIEASTDSVASVRPAAASPEEPASAASADLPTEATAPETRSPYCRIRVSTNLFYTPAVAAPNISLDLNDDGGAGHSEPGTDGKQNYDLAELMQPEPPAWSIAYSNARREEVDSTYLVRHVPPKRNKPLPRAKFNLPKIVVCEICDLDFIGPHELRAHLTVVHRPWALHVLKDVYCAHCRAWFDDEFRYKGHAPCHKSAVRQFCPICYMERPLLEHFALHGVLLRAGNKFLCKLCKSTVRHTLSELNEHRQRKHQRTGVFECLECGAGFARAQDVRLHVHTHLDNDTERNHAKALRYQLKIKTHEDRVYKCDVCDRRFFRKRVCTLHRRTHDRWLCSVCGLSFRNNCLLVEHQNVHSRSTSFDCSVCGKSFTFRKYLTQHARIHRPTKNFDCQFCGLSFAQQTSLIYHTATHTKENIFRCSVCDIRFDKQSKLTSHMQIHNADGSNPHRCRLCQKYFAHHCNLLVHMRMHPEWRPEEKEEAAAKVRPGKGTRQEKQSAPKTKTKAAVVPRRSKRLNRAD